MTRDELMVRDYVEGSSLVKLKEDYSITHERARQILMAQGLVLRRPGVIPTKFGPSFGRLTSKERFFKKITVVKDALLGDHWVFKCNPLWLTTLIKGKKYTANRAAYFFTTGRFPEGNLYKVCKVDRCVHPTHWESRKTRSA